MTPENFCYWLQGWLEVSDTTNLETELDARQLKIIKDHLFLVFHKMTPHVSEHTTQSRPRPPPSTHRREGTFPGAIC